MTKSAEPIERLFVTCDPTDSRTGSGLEILRATLGTYAVTEVAEIQDAQAIVALGGDGGFLHAIQRHDFPGIPITGISTGTLGYYMSTLPTPESVGYMVRNLAEGDYSIRDLPLLELRKAGGALVRFATNDIVIRPTGAQAFKAGLTITNVPFDHFVGGSLIFSTPQGSSGESLAYGGPFIREGLRSWLVTPGAPHMSKEYNSLMAPLVLGPEDAAKVEVKEAAWRPYMISTDGNTVTGWPADDTAMEIGLSADKTIHRIRLNNNTYLQDIARIFRS